METELKNNVLIKEFAQLDLNYFIIMTHMHLINIASAMMKPKN